MVNKSARPMKNMESKPERTMSSLAVKWRPQSINDLVGQEGVATQVKGMIKSGKFPPTLLIHGDSGCGKTTTARIIARTLHCKNLGEDFTPCGTCISCRYGTDHPDVQEVNMAEARGIDDVRALILSSKNMPTISDVRVYIIDECFPGDTDVMLPNGNFAKLEDIVENKDNAFPSVMSYNLDSKRYETKPLTARLPKLAISGKMVRIHLSDGSYQDCTDNHPWWSVTRNKMVTAGDLLENEELLPYEQRTADGNT